MSDRTKTVVEEFGPLVGASSGTIILTSEKLSIVDSAGVINVSPPIMSGTVVVVGVIGTGPSVTGSNNGIAVSAALVESGTVLGLTSGTIGVTLTLLERGV